MSVVSLITAERDRYVAFFEKAASEALAANPQAARELLISINEPAPPYPYRYVRVDVFGKLPDGSDRAYELWLDPAPESEGRGFDLGPATIEIYPFTWCSATVAFNHPPRDIAALEDRLTDLLDIHDERWTENSPASGSIHSVTPMESNGEFSYLTIDSGTAPADALLDLIDFFLDEGSTRVLVQSERRDGQDA